jgi:hypothetical protein
MPLTVRRLVYALLTILGFALMVPLLLNIERLDPQLMVDPLAVPGDVLPWMRTVVLLFLAGLCLAAGFLYLALSTGQPRGWRPIENGQPRCARCGAEVAFGVARCPHCEQQLLW